MINKVSKESLDLTKETLIQLKQLFPETVSEGKINFDKLKLTLGSEISGDENYSFNWAGRKESFKNIQTTAKGTLVADKKESVKFDDTKNLFIEGDNLEALKLLQKAYFNRVKMIYIDPPYNTGKDFVYHDDFKNSIQAYLKQTGQANGDSVMMTTNVETNGRFHSDWISMMYPRLFIARNLLREDGLIFVSIDDNEVHNLRLILNEVFGEENFIGNIVWNSTKSVTNTALISVAHTHNLVYAKNKDYFVENRTEFRIQESGEGFSNLDNDVRGPWKADPFQVGGWRPNQQYDIVNPRTGKVYKPNVGCSWKNDYNRFQELLKDNRIVFGTSGEAGPQRKRFLSEAKERGKVTTTLWDDIDTTTNATTSLKELFGGKSVFDNPKPVALIKRMIELCNGEDSIILDFFAGSGTTAHAVLELNREDGGNRKFILVQLPEKTDEKSEAYKQGYKNIAEITKERIRRAIKKIEKEENGKLIKKNVDLGFKVFKLQKSNYQIWRNYEGQDVKELKKQLQLFKSPLISDYKDIDVIYECIIKEGLSLNANIEEKKLKYNKIYVVSDNGQSFYICLDEKIKADTLDELKLKKDDLFICIDESLDDSKKTNITVQCKLKTL